VKGFRVSALGFLVPLLIVTAGCERGMEELMSGKKHERPPRVALATAPASPSVGEVVLKATITDEEGKAMGDGARIRFLYWKAYQKALSAPEEIVREAPEVAREGNQTYRTKVKLETPGVWKGSVKVERPEKEPTATTFTFDVKG